MRFSVGQVHDGLEFVRILRPSRRSIAYIVRDVVSERLEYLKVVPEHLQSDNDSLQRFLREAKLHASLSHPNVAQFYSVRRIDGELVMTREWVEGQSLESKLAGGPLTVPQTIDYIGQALQALQHVHGRGVLHRDITPARLLITESGVIKLTGFDLARSPADPRLTGTGVVMASVHYMAPEHVRGLSQAEERSDLYALGVVLFEAVTGERPYERKRDFDVMLAHVEDPVPFPRELNEMISPGLEEIIRRSLAKDPGDRFQSAAQFRDALMGEASAEVTRSLDAIPEPAVEQIAPLRNEPVEETPLPVAVTPTPIPPDLPMLSDRFIQESGDWERMAGIAIAGVSLGVLIFLAGMVIFQG